MQNFARILRATEFSPSSSARVESDQTYPQVHHKNMIFSRSKA